MTQGQTRALQQCGHRAALLGEEAAATVLRQMPPRQEIFAAHWAKYPSSAPAIGVEIGFGMGQALAQWAHTEPALPLVGIEVYQPGIGSLLLQAQEQQCLDQLYVLEADARIAFE